MPSAKSVSVAASAIHRAVFASTNRHAIAAAMGTAIRIERIGKPFNCGRSPRHRPGRSTRKSEQHHEGIGIDITRLQPPRRSPRARDERGDAVRPEAVDRALIALLPEEAANREGGA